MTAAVHKTSAISTARHPETLQSWPRHTFFFPCQGADAEAGEKARLSLAGGELQAVRKQGGEHGEKNRDSCNFCGISDEHDWGVCFGCSWCIQDVLGQCTGSNVVQSSKCKARRSNSRWVWGSWHCHPPSPLQIAAATTAALQKLQTQDTFAPECQHSLQLSHVRIIFMQEYVSIAA